MRRINGYNILFYILGQIFLSGGVMLAVKSDFGVAVATAVAYVLNQQLPGITFGTFCYIVQGGVFVLMLAIIKEFKWEYLLAFASAVIMGYVVDLFALLMENMMLISYVARVAALVASVLCAGIGIAFFVKSELPLMPHDIFVKRISQRLEKPFARVKLMYDIAHIIIATTLSFVFFGALVGVSLGTVISAAATGPCYGVVLRLMNKWGIADKAYKLEE